MKKVIIIAFIVCCYCLPVTAQQSLKATVNAVNDMRGRLPVEKLDLQLDKPYYSLGDTLRFKAYLLNADFLTPSMRSGMLYVELDDVAGRMVKRMMVPVASGITWGDIALNKEQDITEGSYTLRAYTNWMRNFGEDYIFKKNIYISALSGSTLVKANFKLDTLNGKNKVQASLRFTNMDRDALRLKDIQLRVMNGRRNLFRDKATTGMDGSMDINFDLADKTAISNLSIKAQQVVKGGDTATLTIPVIINRVENTDIQFMPEGGNLVADIPAKIGFKAISEDGKGTEVKGKIYNSKQQEVAVFSSAHAGMGSFELTPQAGESYTAKVTLTGNVTKNYPLPAIHQTGTALKISEGADSLTVTLAATANLVTAATPITYHLIGQARGVVCYAANISFKEGIIKKVIAKNTFPTGIARFTLLNNLNQPLNERVIFIDHDDNLQISITPNQPVYTTRDSIALAIMVKDKNGEPVQGTFSLAVTDKSQVRTDSLGSTIINNLLFTSDLKGTVEQPGWYFENTGPDRLTALDNLLLTQGWVGYDWKDVFGAATAVKYPAEAEFIIEGKVTNVFNKPVANSGIVLFSQKPLLVRDTITDKDGRFVFKGLYPVDTAIFKIQARNKGGKSFNVGIEMLNDFKPPVFASAPGVIPWYVNSDTLLLNNSSTKVAQLKAEANYRGEGNQLKEVVIKAKKFIKDSKNINGPGEFDEAIDEQEMQKAGKITLEQVLLKKIKGFKIKGIWAPCVMCHINTSYMIDDMLVFFIIDGMNLHELYNGRKFGPIKDPERYTFLKSYMDYFTAEDIKGIEIMKNSAYVANYLFHYVGPTATLPPLAFIEITTYSGHGPYMKITPGTYLYKPLPYTLPKDFYHPRYTAKNSNIASGTDLRSTIHWEPNVITDTAGKATVSFFSADKAADYELIMEGTDLNGNIGYRKQKIKVVTKTVAAK